MGEYDTDRVDTAELEQSTEYFERLYLLEKVGELRPEQMLEDVVVARHVDHPDQADYDLQRLEESIEDLPDGYGDRFREIDEVAAQLDEIRELPDHGDRATLTGTEVREKVEAYVEDSIEADEDAGYEVDDVSRLFYAKSREHQLEGRNEVMGMVDPTYVLDVLE